ncbi:MAG TPA: hypothetical protein VMU95_09780 [Trebonia sp.]|nr:hypothetical protein [Trebonia sp.]
MAQDLGRPGHSHNHSGHNHDHSGPDHEEWHGDAEWDDEDWDELDSDDEVDLKEAFGLPDELPPLRLPSDAELAAAARSIPLLTDLAALAAWVGTDGRAIDPDAELSAAERGDAVAALGVTEEQFAYLWKYAGAVDWIEESDDGRVISGETASEWTEGDEGALNAWSSTFAAVLTEAMCVASTGAQGRPDEVDFHVPGASVALLFFMARREGLTLEDISEVIEESALVDVPPRVEKAWQAYVKASGDPAAVLVAQLAEAGAVSGPSLEDGTIRLTPLGLREMRLQFTDAGVEVPLLSDDPAEVTAEQLVALADGVTDDEFEAESAAWLAARDPQDAARELLAVAAGGDPAQRLLAVALANEIGTAAEPAWREHLEMLELRPYAKMTLVKLAGLENAATLPPELEPDIDDLAWMAIDLLAVACADEDTDPAELAEAFSEAMPPDGDSAQFLDLLSRGPHPDSLDVLEHIGEYHPDKVIAKEAKKVLYKASMREAARQRSEEN